MACARVRDALKPACSLQPVQRNLADAFAESAQTEGEDSPAPPPLGLRRTVTDTIIHQPPLPADLAPMRPQRTLTDAAIQLPEPVPAPAPAEVPAGPTRDVAPSGLAPELAPLIPQRMATDAALPGTQPAEAHAAAPPFDGLGRLAMQRSATEGAMALTPDLQQPGIQREITDAALPHGPMDPAAGQAAPIAEELAPLRPRRTQTDAAIRPPALEVCERRR